MKIVLISSAYHPYYRGGGEYSVKLLAEGLLRQGHTVRVITAHEQASQEEIEGVSVYRIPHPNIYWSYRGADKPGWQKLLWHTIESYNVRVATLIKPVLEQEQPDVVHIRNVEDFSPYVGRVASDLGIPVLVTLNSYTWLCPKATMFRSGHNCLKQCRDCRLITYPKKYLSQYVDSVVGVSRFMIDAHRRAGYFLQARTDVVYTSAQPQPRIPTEPDRAIRFGYIGRIHPTKGVYEVIQAFLALAPGAELHIAGEGPEEYVQQCKTLSNSHPDIYFLGKVAAPDFYQQVDVVLVSSLWNEPFPRVLVEAYSYGKPVIASRTGGTAEKVVSERTGFLFDPRDQQQLLEHMRAFAQMDHSQRVAMQEEVITYLKEEFPDEVQQYVSLYQSLLD